MQEKFSELNNNFDQKKWIRAAADLVNAGGTIIVFNDWKNLGMIAEQLEKCGFIIKDIIRWIKKNPMPRNVDRRYVNDCEFAIWAVKEGKPWTFNKPKKVGYLNIGTPVDTQAKNMVKFLRYTSSLKKKNIGNSSRNTI